MPLSCAVSLVYAIILAVSGSEAFSFDTIGAIIFNGLIVNIGILVIKVINRKRAKKLHMSEIEYTRKYIDKKIKRA
ncbi:MAG: hypothetical protein MJ233_04580 [Mycoplasmoidaceae bacterium]|nr:hypothetical protein [Mycoplasmoidaceae bacterium]